jgi:hypothetical protein
LRNRKSAINTLLTNTLAQSIRADLLDGSGFDTKSLNFSFETDLGKDRQGRKALNLEPASAVDEAAWLASLSELSSLELAKRLGVTDRQVRRIRTGKVSTARLREHAKADAERTTGRTPPVP